MARNGYTDYTHQCGCTIGHNNLMGMTAAVAARTLCRECARDARAAQTATPVVAVSVSVTPVAPIAPLTHTAEGMVIAALERGIDVAARFAAWNEDELSEEDDW